MVYEGHLRNHFAGFDDLEINRITTARVEKFITARQTGGIHILTLHEVKENIKYIQTQLGHSSPVVTLNLYAHLMEPRIHDAACRLEDTIFGNGHVSGTKSSKGLTHSELTP